MITYIHTYIQHNIYNTSNSNYLYNIAVMHKAGGLCNHMDQVSLVKVN